MISNGKLILYSEMIQCGSNCPCMENCQNGCSECPFEGCACHDPDNNPGFWSLRIQFLLSLDYIKCETILSEAFHVCMYLCQPNDLNYGLWCFLWSFDFSKFFNPTKNCATKCNESYNDYLYECPCQVGCASGCPCNHYDCLNTTLDWPFIEQ